MQIFRFVPRKPCLATDLHRLWKIIQLIGVACTALWRCVTQVTSRTGLHMASACRKFQKRPSALEACIFCPGAVCKKSKRSLDQGRLRLESILAESFPVFLAVPVTALCQGDLAYPMLVFHSLGTWSWVDISLMLGHQVSLQSLLRWQHKEILLLDPFSEHPAAW